MPQNPETGIKIVAPADWNLEPAAGWDQRTPEQAQAAAKLGHTPPMTMLVNSANPYIDLLEEPPHHYSSVHHHTEPEILVILRGSMTFNGQTVGPGAMIFIPANEEYWHATTDEACLVGVIRPSERGFLVGGAAARNPAHKAREPENGPVPYPLNVEEGKRYLWCACGRSTQQPLCDGASHKETGVTPLLFRAKETMGVTLCGCKRTHNPPFCDGSHVHCPVDGKAGPST